jgi:hypothetical protein
MIDDTNNSMINTYLVNIIVINDSVETCVEIIKKIHNLKLEIIEV